MVSWQSYVLHEPMKGQLTLCTKTVAAGNLWNHDGGRSYSTGKKTAFLSLYAHCQTPVVDVHCLWMVEEKNKRGQP